jgi:hypothetical protein
MEKKMNNIIKNINNSPKLVGQKVIDLDGFKFNEKILQSNLARLVMLFLTLDPTPKQKELLNKIGVVLLDDYGKQFFPQEEENEVGVVERNDNDYEKK